MQDSGISLGGSMKRKHAQIIPKDVDPQQTTRISFILIFAALGTYLIVCLISLYFHDWKTVWTVCVGSILLALPFWLLRSKHYRSGNLILMVIVLASVTAIATVGQGIRDLAIVAYPVVFIYVGLTSDRSMLRLCGGLTFIALLWLAFGESLGWFATVPLFPDSFNLFYLAVLTVLLIVTAIAVDLLSSNLKKSLERVQTLATLVESANDAIVGTDLERRITAWNKGAERMYGYSAGEMIGSAFSPLIPPEEEEDTRTMRERVMHGEQVTNFETTRLRKDGSKIIVSMTLSAIRDPQGKIVGLASTARDITEQKAVQAAQRRAERLESLATLAGGIAHQFNNIAAVVSGYLQMLQSEKDLPPRSASYVEAAYVGVQKEASIIEKLLILTERADSSESLRLDVLARGVLQHHQKRIEDEKVRLVLDFVETPFIMGSEERLKFVLAALVGNALDSLLDRPERMLGLRTGSTKDAVYFEVEDSGCGIPAEDLPRIFSPFFSAKGEWAPKDSPQARLKGIGLDLAISSMTVSEYRGRIDVQSTKEVGSTFRMVLPVSGR